jgi:uncharacterized protein (DUF433 family)
MVKPGSNIVVSAFTEEQVERLTGISVNRLRYWDRTGFFIPSLAASNRRSSYSRIYSFSDVASLRVISVLVKQYSVRLSHLRQVVTGLGGMDNAAWARTTLYVLNRKVIFDDPEAGRQREIVSGQYMIGIKLNEVLSDTKRDVESLSARSPDQLGRIVQSRTIAHNSPVISGTRVPVRNIKEFHAAGYTIEEILNEYPSLTDDDVRAAIGHIKAA